ncbi:hypothetical protein AAY473_031107 [Plecturocebus cupreus]
MRHYTTLIFAFLVETGFCHVGQGGLKLLTSGELTTLASQSAGTAGSPLPTAGDVMCSHREDFLPGNLGPKELLLGDGKEESKPPGCRPCYMSLVGQVEYCEALLFLRLYLGSAFKIKSFLQSLALAAPPPIHTHCQLTMDDDIAALVVDNGSCMCKASFVSDDAP